MNCSQWQEWQDVGYVTARNRHKKGKRGDDTPIVVFAVPGAAFASILSDWTEVCDSVRGIASPSDAIYR